MQTMLVIKGMVSHHVSAFTTCIFYKSHSWVVRFSEVKTSKWHYINSHPLLAYVECGILHVTSGTMEATLFPQDTFYLNTLPMELHFLN